MGPFSAVTFNRWPYPIMNAWLPMGVMWYTVFFVGNMLVFCACYGLHKFKLSRFGLPDWDGTGILMLPTVDDEESTPFVNDDRV